MKSLKLIALLAAVVAVTGIVQAGIITSVDRYGGQSGDRAWIGVFDGDTDPSVGLLKNGDYVFSDRTYPWSGVTGPWLEQVKTFNSDKDSSRGLIWLTYAVTIGESAQLGILIDDRVADDWAPSMQEAADLATYRIGAPGTFTDSGLDAYVHENDTTDRPMSLFLSPELPAGTYLFGLQPSGKNFYSIVAIPEPASMVLLGLGGLLLRRRRR